MKDIYKLSKSNRKGKKYMIELPSGKIVYFGASGYGDYIIWNKKEGKQYADMKKRSYIARHKVNENWGKSGMNTAGFWSRWILWNKPSLIGSVKNTMNKFNIKISKK